MKVNVFEYGLNMILYKNSNEIISKLKPINSIDLSEEKLNDISNNGNYLDYFDLFIFIQVKHPERWTKNIYKLNEYAVKNKLRIIFLNKLKFVQSNIDPIVSYDIIEHCPGDLIYNCKTVIKIEDDEYCSIMKSDIFKPFSKIKLEDIKEGFDNHDISK